MKQQIKGLIACLNPGFFRTSTRDGGGAPGLQRGSTAMAKAHSWLRGADVRLVPRGDGRLLFIAKLVSSGRQGPNRVDRSRARSVLIPWFVRQIGGRGVSVKCMGCGGRALMQ
jgi:hypothetical protein